MTYVLLNQVRSPSGRVAPGTTYADDSEQIPALLLYDAVFGEISVVGAEAVTLAEKKKRRGAPWEEIELALIDEAGKNIAALCQRARSTRCERHIIPTPPPIHVPCSPIVPYTNPSGLDPLIVMRGSRMPSGALIWAGDMVNGELAEFAAREGLELVWPTPGTNGPVVAMAFAEEVAVAKRNGERTWEENEQAATRARFGHCAERCYHRAATCPPLYHPVGSCAFGCYPYLGQAPPIVPWRPFPWPWPKPRPPIEP